LTTTRSVLRVVSGFINLVHVDNRFGGIGMKKARFISVLRKVTPPGFEPGFSP
jgi:hypothetical protein